MDAVPSLPLPGSCASEVQCIASSSGNPKDEGDCEGEDEVLFISFLTFFLV